MTEFAAMPPPPAVYAEEYAIPEYAWYRASKFALPALLFMLAVAAVVFCLAVWQGQTTYKHIREGIPRIYEFRDEDRIEGSGLPVDNRNLRIAAFVICAVAVVLILLVMYAKPALKARKAAYFGLGFILFVGGVLSIIAFALDAGDVNRAERCRRREFGNVDIPNCPRNLRNIANAAAATDLALGVFAILAVVCLVVAAIKSGKGVVSYTTKRMVILLLLLTIAMVILSFVWTVMLVEAKDTLYKDEVYGVRRYTNFKPGWPVKNTRLRMAISAAVILTILINLIPFRSRVIHYGFAFLLFFASVPLLISFALDVKEVDNARKDPCPSNFKCTYGPYVATIFFEIFLAVLLVFYVIFEFVFRLSYDTTHLANAVY
jgi:multisubunit Na+/H+ antiporter MnhB subunit